MTKAHFNVLKGGCRGPGSAGALLGSMAGAERQFPWHLRQTLGLPASAPPPPLPWADQSASLITICPGVGVGLEGVLGPPCRKRGGSVHLHAALAGGTSVGAGHLPPEPSQASAPPSPRVPPQVPPVGKTGCGRPELKRSAGETLPGSDPSRSTNAMVPFRQVGPGGEAGRGQLCPGFSCRLRTWASL